jgi:hypothetical protein
VNTEIYVIIEPFGPGKLIADGLELEGPFKIKADLGRL